MSISYQKKLIDLVESAKRKDCFLTKQYQGFYIHSACYDHQTVFHVNLIGCASFYSKSQQVVRARIRQFKKDFGV